MTTNSILSRLSRLAFGVFCASALLPAATGCSTLDDDDHYKNSQSSINNPELRIVNTGSEEYIRSRADLRQMDALFQADGIYSELESKGQLSTILVVRDEHFRAPEGSDEDRLKVTRSHVSDISVSPANLHNGDRLMMWHRKYVNVSIDEQGREGQIVGHIAFNNASVEEVIQTRNGYIYVISDMIATPSSLRDFIDNLGPEYSQFQKLVAASGGKVFDRANSKPTGVNAEGNTTYDTVWIYTNTHFENVGIDLNSESLTATLLLPSDDVIDAAMADARRRLASWGMTRSDEVLRNWILDVCFFGRRLTTDELSGPEAQDVNSVFGKQWRPSAQQLADPSQSVQLSNGVVHLVKKLHIPNNVLMYRLKDWFYLYENCTDQQKTDYFKMTNMVFKSCSTDVGAWSPLEGVWPKIQDRCLNLSVGDDGQGSAFRLDFTPVRLVDDADGSHIEAYIIPPGSYRLAFGSKQNQNLDIRATVLVEGQVIATSPLVTLGSATTYHYDRGATLSNRYPEGYDPAEVIAKGGSNKAGNYDTDGGLLIEEVVIPDLRGDGSALPVTIRIEGDSWKEQSTFTLAHWCLRPTVNNY